MKRFSKKRQSIAECFKNTNEHPSAEAVYLKLKAEYPSLSLATVYRNIKELEEEGIIRSVGKVSEKERFDGNTAPHSHAVCSVCGKVIDIFDIPFPKEISEKAASETGFSVRYAEMRFSGVCPECRKKE